MKDEVEILENTFAYIKKIFSTDSSGHDYYHSVRVYHNALSLVHKEGGNLFVVKLAALLHDVDDRKLFDTSDQLQNARRFMSDNDLDESLIEEICNIIKSVSFKGSDSVTPPTIEGKIVQDADRLDALGAIGIARTFAYGGHNGRAIYEPNETPVENMTAEVYEQHRSTSINHFYEKLLKLKDLMNTNTAKAMAEYRHSYMEEFLDEFMKEWKGVR